MLLGSADQSWPGQVKNLIRRGPSQGATDAVEGGSGVSLSWCPVPESLGEPLGVAERCLAQLVLAFQRPDAQTCSEETSTTRLDQPVGDTTVGRAHAVDHLAQSRNWI